jgi:hypothetical protein
MDHAAFARREVNIAEVPSGFVRGDQDQMHAIAHLGKHQALASLNPGQRRGVRQQQMRVAAQDAHFPGIPRSGKAVDDARVIRREGRRYLHLPVMCELHGFAIGQQLHVDLAGPHERTGAADEGKGTSVRGQSWVDG